MHISPSQISTFLDCPRKWAYRALDGIRTPQTRGAALGSAAHLALERAIRDGIEPDQSDEPGRIAAAALRHLPDRELIESEQGLRRGTLRGTVDVLGRIPVKVSERGKFGLVADLKTSSDVKRYAKATNELVEDPQGIVYPHLAEALLRERGATTGVELRWIYVQTNRKREPATSVTSALVTWEHVEDRARAIREVLIPGMREIRDRARAETRALRLGDSVVPDARACGNYGGCPYRAFCPLTNEQKLEAAMSHVQQEGKKTMWEKIASSPALNAPPGPYTGVNRPPPEAEAGPAVVGTVVPAAGAPTEVQVEHAGPVQGSLSFAPVSSGPAQEMDRALQTWDQAATAGPVLNPDPSPTRAPEPPERVADGTGARAVTRPTGGRGFVLLDECVLAHADAALGLRVVRGSELVAAANEVVCRDAGEALAFRDWTAVSHGRGRGMLRVALEGLLDASPEIGPGAVVVLDRGQAADVIRDVLAARAGVHVVGRS